MMLSLASIERRARQLLKEHRINGPRVDVYALADRLGVTIREQGGESDISGALFRQGGQTVIGINSAHPPRRKRFTVAHELGHLVLHDDLVQVDRHYMVMEGLSRLRPAALRDKLSGEARDPREIEANRFAAALLMPSDFVERSLRRYTLPLDESTIRKMADEFDVSLQAMNFRLTNLGAPLDLAGHHE
jgi:Zn-dependent peptidase ImmA (M78 family)